MIALAITASSAHADTTRAQWVGQVDPICQSGLAQEAVAAQPLDAVVRRAQKHHSRKTNRRIARTFIQFFQQYAAIERAVNAQIATIPPAPEDVSLVQVWLRARGELLDLQAQFFTGGFKSKKGLKGLNQIFSLLFQLAGRQQEVVDLVRDFGFVYCNQTPPETQFLG